MEDLRSVYWEALEHPHIEKSGDWYWILGIVGLAGAVVSIILGNVLFGMVILLGMITMVLVSHRLPRTLPYEISVRGVRVGSVLYPYATLDSYYIDEEHRHGPQLIVKSKKLFVPLLILPLPSGYVDDVEDIIAPRLREEHLHEPLAHHLLEFFGF